MANAYQIIAKSSTGIALGTLDGFIDATINLVVSAVGAADISLPYTAYNASFFAADNLIEVWRSVDGGLFYLLGGTAFLMRKLSKLLRPSGEKLLNITGLDLKDVVARRLVAYANQSSQASETGPADDIIKVVANENMSAAAVDTTRNLGNYFVIAPNLSAAPTLYENAPHRRLSDLFKETTDSSYTAGTYLAWDIGYDPSQSLPVLTLNTYTGQRGVDHRWPSSSAPLFFDPEQGSIVDVERSYDYRDLRNRVYAGGSGIGPFQPIATANDLASQGLGPFNLVEEFLAISNTSDPNSLQTDAFEAMRRLRARRTYTARAVNTPFLRFGVEYDFGDFDTTALYGELLDARLDGVSISLADGEENVSLILRSDT